MEADCGSMVVYDKGSHSCEKEPGVQILNGQNRPDSFQWAEGLPCSAFSPCLEHMLHSVGVAGWCDH